MGAKEVKSKDQLLIKLRKIMKKGDKKSSTFAAEEALKFYKRSLDNLEKRSETPENLANKVEMELLLAEILYILGRWDTSISYLTKIQKRGPDKAGTARVTESYLKSGNLWALKGDIDRCFADYGKALKMAKELDDPETLADAERGLGYAHWRRGNIADAEKQYGNAFKALKGVDNEDLLAKTYLESGNVYNDKGDLNKAVDYYMKAIRVFRKVKDIYQEARAYNNLGDVCIKRKEWKKGIRYFQKTAALADSINDLHMQGWALFNGAECHSKSGDLGEAEGCCTRALDMLSRIDDKIGIAYVFCNYGIVYRFKKEWAKSTKYFKFSLNIVKNIRTPGLEAYVLKEFAEMQNDWGKKQKAKELAIEARNIYSNMEAKYYVETMNEIMARIEGREYEMDISLSKEAMDAVERESEALASEPLPMVQEPIVFEEKAPPVKARPKVGKKEPEPFIVVRPATVVGAKEEVGAPEPEEPKAYLFMPPVEDEALRRLKVRFFVELPFVAPEVEVEEIKKGDDPELERGVTEYPSVKILGKVLPGIPKVKEIANLLKDIRLASKDTDVTKMVIAKDIPVGDEGPIIQTSSVASTVSDKIKFHYSYLVEGEDHSKAYGLFNDMMSRGAKGLVVTRPPVRKLKDMFKLDDAEFLLFSISDSPREGQVQVKDVKEIGNQIEAFIETHETSVVVIDRAEVIIENAGFDKFLKMVHLLNECLDTCKSCLLVPLDPQFVGNIEMRTLRREITTL